VGIDPERSILYRSLHQWRERRGDHGKPLRPIRRPADRLGTRAVSPQIRTIARKRPAAWLGPPYKLREHTPVLPCVRNLVFGRASFAESGRLGR
jgi:hypothetical protein